jgi:hypothetical protein
MLGLQPLYALTLRLIDGPYRPSDRFLRLHFNESLFVSVCRGDIMEDYKDTEIEKFTEELGVYDGRWRLVIQDGEPRWVHTSVLTFYGSKMVSRSVLFWSGNTSVYVKT